MPQIGEDKGLRRSQAPTRSREPWINRRIVDPVEKLSRRVTGRPIGLPRAKQITEPNPYASVIGGVGGAKSELERPRNINKPVPLPDYEEKVGPRRKRPANYKEPA